MLLEVEGVSRWFGGMRALNDVSFGVREGEITGLIGPNGAGKSTLFDIIAGARAPSSGLIRFDGRTVTGWRAHQAAKAGVGRTFQLMRTFESMTVQENVAVASYLRHPHRSTAFKAAREALELTGMAPLAQVPAGTLTAPSRKRLEIARALALQPKLLLLDEVLSGLTPTEGQEAVELLRVLNGRGITILMVEHVMEVIMPLCDRLVVLNQGHVLKEGSPGEIARDPLVLEAYLGQA